MQIFRVKQHFVMRKIYREEFYVVTRFLISFTALMLDVVSSGEVKLCFFTRYIVTAMLLL